MFRLQYFVLQREVYLTGSFRPAPFWKPESNHVRKALSGFKTFEDEGYNWTKSKDF